MNLKTDRYLDHSRTWPSQGQHILAQFDDQSIIVYQAYRPEIARYAMEHRALGGSGFSYARMSWIKPNFLWMMYRSGWGTKSDQQSTLALRIRRKFFDELLAQAVLSSFDASRHQSRQAWQKNLAQSQVRLQWDPDHDPHGAKQARRALQLGLRGAVLEQFGKHELLEVIDLSDFVAAQRKILAQDSANLQTPIERIYHPTSDAAATNAGLSQAPAV